MSLHEIAYPANENYSACAVVLFLRLSVLRQESSPQRRQMNVPVQRPVGVLDQCNDDGRRLRRRRRFSSMSCSFCVRSVLECVVSARL